MVSVIIRHNLHPCSGLCVKNVTKRCIFRLKARPLSPSNFCLEIPFLIYWKKSLYMIIFSINSNFSDSTQDACISKNPMKAGSCWAEPSLCNFNHRLLWKGWGGYSDQLGRGGKLITMTVIIQIIRQEQREVLFNIHYSGCEIRLFRG